MTRTCDGRCCAVFPLPKRIAAELEQPDAQIQDRAFIHDMIVPLTRRQALARARRFGYRLPWRNAATHDLFTCRHWDETTRLCTVYEQRPAMCRDYPYDHRCDHRDCCYTASQKTRARWRAIRRRRAKAVA